LQRHFKDFPVGARFKEEGIMKTKWYIRDNASEMARERGYDKTCPYINILENGEHYCGQEVLSFSGFALGGGTPVLKVKTMSTSGSPAKSYVDPDMLIRREVKPTAREWLEDAAIDGFDFDGGGHMSKELAQGILDITEG